MDTSPSSRSRRRPRPAAASSGITHAPADCDATAIAALDHRLGGYASRVDGALRRARQLTDRAEAYAEAEADFELSPPAPAADHAHHDDATTAEATARRFLSDRRRRLGLDGSTTSSTCAGQTQRTQTQRRLEAVADALLNFPSSSSPSSASSSSAASSLAELSRLCSSVYESNAVGLATVEDGLVHGGGGYGGYGGGGYDYEYGGYGTYDGTEARRAAIAALEGRHRHQQLAAADAEADDYGADDCDGDDNDNDGDDDAATIISLGSLGTEEEMLTDGIIGVGQPPPPHLEAICEGGGREQQQQQQR